MKQVSLYTIIIPSFRTDRSGQTVDYNDRKCLETQVWAASVDSHQTAPDQVLHSLLYCLH